MPSCTLLERPVTGHQSITPTRLGMWRKWLRHIRNSTYRPTLWWEQSDTYLSPLLPSSHLPKDKELFYIRFSRLCCNGRLGHTGGWGGYSSEASLRVLQRWGGNYPTTQRPTQPPSRIISGWISNCYIAALNSRAHLDNGPFRLNRTATLLWMWLLRLVQLCWMTLSSFILIFWC